MARLPRLCVPGWPHLVLQQGHNREPAFRDDADRALFRQLLHEAAPAHGVQVHAYGLQDGEVRLLITPSAADALSGMMQAIGRRYVASFNRRHGRSGALWDGRFRGTVVEPRQHLLPCMLFVEGLVSGDDDPTHAPWSSAAHHLGLRTESWITDPPQFWSLGNTPFEREAAYRLLVKQALTETELRRIATAVMTGWPLGDEAFVATLAENTPRRLAPLARGRPRRAVNPSV
jgi:putative transposase